MPKGAAEKSAQCAAVGAQHAGLHHVDAPQEESDLAQDLEQGVGGGHDS